MQFCECLASKQCDNYATLLLQPIAMGVDVPLSVCRACG